LFGLGAQERGDRPSMSSLLSYIQEPFRNIIEPRRY
jgi:hypothetical protein